MRSVHRSAAVVVLLSLSVCAHLRLDAQERSAWRSFLSTLSFDSYYGILYDSYHGFATGGRLAVPLFTVPALNRLVWAGSRTADALMFTPGLKLGLVQTEEFNSKTGTLLFAPEASLHYSFLKTDRLRIYAGPAVEYIFTNNLTKYKAVPTAGIDLGLMVEPAFGIALAIEHRWTVYEKTTRVVNHAVFPQRGFSQIGLVLRFSLPWKSEASGYAEAASAYERRERDALALHERTASARADSLGRETEALRDSLRVLTQARARAAAPRTAMIPDRYTEGVTTADAIYTFTKDPFAGGNLVDDRYLKNVLIDILDDDYVWQLSANSRRTEDAEKIRTFFVLLNANLARRLVIAQDDHERLFKLTCLGKTAAAAQPAAGTTR